MRLSRVVAIPAHLPSLFKMETLETSEADCFGALAVALGIEQLTLMQRLHDYSFVSTDFADDFIKAEFIHVRYDIKARSDSIITENVKVAWVRASDGISWEQFGVVRTAIENRNHYKTDKGFENAASALIADNLNARLGTQEGTDTISRVGYCADLTNMSVLRSNGTEKSPASVEIGGLEKSPAKCGGKKKARRHGRGRH